MSDPETFRGSCMCGSVTYEFDGALDGVVCCHCTQCRKQTGHHFATVEADKNRFRLTNDSSLTWYQASPIARRGFCNNCGSSLFWDMFDAPKIDILAGSVDGSLGVGVKAHVHVSEKGDYYELAGDAAHFPKGRKG